MRDDLERARLGEPLAGAGAVAAGAAVPVAAVAAAAGSGNDATQVIAPVLPGTGPACRRVGGRAAVASRLVRAAGAAVVGALVLAFFLGRSIFGGTDANIAVPNVVGLKQADAVAQLTEHGLKLGTVTPVTSDTVPAGYVVSQDPLKDVKVVADTAVDLTSRAAPSR